MRKSPSEQVKDDLESFNNSTKHDYSKFVDAILAEVKSIRVFGISKSKCNKTKNGR